VHKLEKQLYKTKAENSKNKTLVKRLIEKLAEVTPQPVEPNQLTESPRQHQHHPHHPHHRTVRIHSETETKSELFSQHQTRDVSMSLESGDSLSPAELARQMQALQSSFSETQAEKEALLQQVS